MNKIKSNNYVTIQGWMYQIGLSDLKEIITYAAIYGFSQDGESEFNGSVNYLCELLVCSKNTARDCIKRLIDNGFITKQQVVYNNVTFNKYKAIVPNEIKQCIGCAEIDRGGQKLTGGGSEIDPNNNSNINNTVITPLSPKGKTQAQTLDLSFIPAEYLPIMKEWLDYKKERRQTYTQRGLRQCYNNLYQLSDGDTEKAWAIVAQSIGNNYSGLFQLKENASHSCGITMEEIKRRSMEISMIRKQMKENSFL